MALTLIGFVFGPLLMMAITIFLFQDKGRRIFLAASGILFFMAALYPLLSPQAFLFLHIPQIVWKFLTLGTVGLLFLQAVRDKHAFLSLLSAVQMVILILSEILLSPDEPVVFLRLQMEERLLLLAGAFLVAVFLSVMACGNSAPNSGYLASRRCLAGIFIMMSAFSGLLCARSLTGLFLFAQWGYLGNHLINRAFCGSDKRQFIPVLQQLALTAWIAAAMFIYAGTGTMLAEELRGAGEISGLIAVLVFLLVFSLGLFIPEKRMLREILTWPVPVMGLWMLLFSMLVPFSVLLKFRLLFAEVGHNLASVAVSLGALMMAANAFYAGNAQKDQESITHMVLFVSGWGVIGVFTGLEGAFFSVSYILAAAVAFAFMYCYVFCFRPAEDSGVSETRVAAALAWLRSIISGLFVFMPFTLATLCLVYIRLMSGYGVAMLFTTAGLVILAAGVLRRLLLPRAATENHAPAGIYGVILPLILAAVVAVNLLAAPIYRLLQSQPLAMGVWPAADLEELVGIGKNSPLNAGFVYMGISFAVLATGCFFTAAIRRSRGASEQTGVFAPYSLISWLPSGLHIDMWIRAAWITAATLLVGVALSCLMA